MAGIDAWMDVDDQMLRPYGDEEKRIWWIADPPYLPVRGRFRVTCMMIGSAIITNVRRIQRYQQTKTKLENEQMKVQREQECSQEQLSVSFFASLKNIFSNWMANNSDCNFKLGLPN